MLAAFLTTILFSISVVCGHRSAKLIGGTEANFWRLTMATLMLGVWAYGFGIGLAGNAFPIFFWSGIMGIGIGDVALFQALPRLGSRLSLLLIQCLTAPFGALIDYIVNPAGADPARIAGEPQLAETVRYLAAHLRWDAEDDLARLFGDIAALRILPAATNPSLAPTATR